MSSPLELARPEIRALKAYDHAAWEPSLERLHANELPWAASDDGMCEGLNRYPEPQPRALIERLAGLYAVPPECILAGRGSDEAIDLLSRGFCRAGEDAVIVCPPTFGMYAIAARIQGADVLRVPLQVAQDFALDEDALLQRCTSNVKLVFLCSPNNPTGNLLSEPAVLRIAASLAGRALVVVDEAYVEFAGQPSLARHVARLSHLVVLRTLSKAHGLAGARCGTLIASAEIVSLLRKIIPPYALTQFTIETVLRQLEPVRLEPMRVRVAELGAERAWVAAHLRDCAGVVRVWPSQANFVLVEFHDATSALAKARAAGLLLRDVRSQPGLERALRITIGTPEQNRRLLRALQ
jgi:histidinol-phosphate aminotransferase